MAKALAKKEESAVTLVGEPDVGNEEILASNIIIPRVLIMQGLSELVADGKAVMGELIRSTTNEKLGGPDKPIDFIPITYNTTWIKQEKVGGKFEYRGQEPLNAANQDLPWDFEEKGIPWKRVKALNLYALLVQDVTAEQAEMAKAKQGEMPDPDKALLPVMISFRSTGFTTGKTIVTHFAKAKKFGLPGYVSVLKLSVRKEKNDKGTFFVPEVTNSGKTPADVIETCKYWQTTLATKPVEVDAAGEDETATGAPRQDTSGEQRF
jgi:hypothetical protein